MNARLKPDYSALRFRKYFSGIITSLFSLNLEIRSSIGILFALVFFTQTSWAQWIQTKEIARVSAFIHIGGYLFAATYEGIIRSEDNGRSWVSADSGLTDRQVNCLAKKGAVLFAGTVSKGVFKSNDDGNTWVQINQGLTEKWIMALLEINGQLIAGTEGGSIFQSLDGGDTWKRNNTVYFHGVSGLSSRGSSIFASSKDGVYRSSDAGDSWTLVTSAIPSVQCISTIGEDLLISTDKGVYRSSDNGETWLNVYRFDFNASPWINTLGYVNSFSQEEDRLFIGSDSGVFFSTDNWKSWTKLPMDLAYPRIISTAISDSYLVAGSYDSGIRIYPLAGASNTIIPPAHEGELLSWVNPKSGMQIQPGMDISFHLYHESWIEIGIFDLSGIKKATLVNRLLEPGNHILPFDKGWSRRKYFLKMETKNPRQRNN